MNQLIPVGKVKASLSEDNLLDVDPELLKEESELEEKVEKLKTDTETLRETISSFLAELDSNCPYESALLKELIAEINKIADSQQTSEISKEEEEEYLKDLLKVASNNEYLRESIEKTRRQNEALANKNLKAKSSSLKKLYKKIAVKCHPDKTNNKLLHEFLNIAKEALNNNDYATMESILHCIANKKSWGVWKTQKKIVELKEQEQVINSELRSIAQSADYKNYLNYTAKIPILKATIIFRHSQSLKAKVSYMQSRLKELKEIK
jgi:hypothetical protein